jgi:hypothetical protein
MPQPLYPWRKQVSKECKISVNFFGRKILALIFKRTTGKVIGSVFAVNKTRMCRT